MHYFTSHLEKSHLIMELALLLMRCPGNNIPQNVTTDQSEPRIPESCVIKLEKNMAIVLFVFLVFFSDENLRGAPENCKKKYA